MYPLTNDCKTMSGEQKRLFFGMQAVAPWPEEFPEGKVLLPENRHLTLAFLGSVDWNQIRSFLDFCPLPSFSLGPSGYFDHPIFLPEASPHVAAWHVQLEEQKQELLAFWRHLTIWTQGQGLTKNQEKEPLLHVTIAREPFVQKEWESAFMKRPCFFKNLNLYESLGNSTYRIVWQHPILPPFEEKEHTADIAWNIRGKTVQQIYAHAKLALAFQEPKILEYGGQITIETLDQTIQALNALLSEMDQKEGSPFKAVSYHGNLQETKESILEWEMIVDV